MLEVVLLQDVMASFATNWHRIATTEGVDTIKIGDVFREKGAGPGAEEIKVEALDLSPIPGGSRLLINRSHNRVSPQSYRLGAVLQRVETAVPSPAADLGMDLHVTAPLEVAVPVKRGPGRPRKEPVLVADPLGDV